MRHQSPLKLSIIYICLGIAFTAFAIQTVTSSGWGFFAYFLIFIATLDFGSGIRMLLLHVKIKSIQKKK